MIAKIISNKRSSQVVSELLIRGRKINIYTVFITQVYVPVRKDVKLKMLDQISE